jgi:hypothetical protein
VPAVLLHFFLVYGIATIKSTSISRLANGILDHLVAYGGQKIWYSVSSSTNRNTRRADAHRLLFNLSELNYAVLTTSDNGASTNCCLGPFG